MYRTGPGDYKVETENGAYALSHWFDGFTQLHRFHLVAGDDGCRVYYNSRRQVDELMETARKDGTLNGVVTFGQKRDPCQSFFGKIKSSFQSTVPDKNRVGLWNVGVTVARNMPGLPGENRLTCLTDANMIQQADMETLEPLGVADQTALHPDLKVQPSILSPVPLGIADRTGSNLGGACRTRSQNRRCIQFQPQLRTICNIQSVQNLGIYIED